MRRLQDAQNRHDAGAIAAVFAADYQSDQPVHPSRSFVGNDQVLTNWSSVFAGVPDFHATLIASAGDDQTEWGEWEWHGSHPDGSPFLMRGVTIVIVENGLIRAARLYMDPVESDGSDIDVAVQDLYRPPSST